MCRYVFVRITEDNALTYTNPPCSLECWEEIQGRPAEIQHRGIGIRGTYRSR
jgi:hypothetical protein